MKSCPLCGGPAPDRPGFPGALLCDRCAGAIDVSRALENAGPAPRPRRRFPWPWIAGGAAVLLGGLLVGWLIPSRAEFPPPKADVEPLLADARRRLDAPLPASFEAALEESTRIERLLGDANRLDPGRADIALLHGQVLLARGDEGALRAFEHALRLGPSNPEALVGKGERVVTTRLLLHLDRLRWPELTKSLSGRLASSEGPAFSAISTRLPPGSPEAAFARAYAAVARADWTGAKRALDPVPRSALSERMKDELGYTMFAIDYLADPKVPPPGAWAGLIQGDEGRAFEFGERGVWLLLVKHLERKALLARLPVYRSPRHPLHAGLLRAEAALHESKGDARRAAAVLGEAIRAAPDYLQARLARADALSKLGETAEAKHDLDAALRLATDWALPAAVLREIGD